MAKARHLAGLVRVPEADVEQALATRPAGRVVEVLEWMKTRRAQTAIKSPAALFWNVVARD